MFSSGSVLYFQSVGASFMLLDRGYITHVYRFDKAIEIMIQRSTHNESDRR